MRVFQFESEIGDDQILRIELQTNLPPGPVECVIVLESIASRAAPAAQMNEGVPPAE